VYGTFPGAIWNGGRVFHGTTNADNIEQTIKGFNDLGVPVRFTFTNCLLEEKHVYDTYCNLIMEKANNGMNKVLVNSYVLEDYLRNEYPNFKYISSTTKCERSLDAINDACKKYDLVVTDYRDNVDDAFLSSLKHKDKIEILINANCNPACQRRSQHYTDLSARQLGFDNSPFSICSDERKSFYEVLNLYPTVLRDADMKKFQEIGFSNFKIEGRTNHNADVIESYVYYMVKPEYRDEVRLKMIRELWR
jgi:collagenase-like PrtC family protease